MKPFFIKCHQFHEVKTLNVHNLNSLLALFWLEYHMPSMLRGIDLIFTCPVSTVRNILCHCLANSYSSFKSQFKVYLFRPGLPGLCFLDRPKWTFSVFNPPCISLLLKHSITSVFHENIFHKDEAVVLVLNIKPWIIGGTQVSI